MVPMQQPAGAEHGWRAGSDSLTHLHLGRPLTCSVGRAENIRSHFRSVTRRMSVDSLAEAPVGCARPRRL